MFIDDDYIRFYDPTYMDGVDFDDIPLECPYRQMNPFPFFPGGPQGPKQGPPNFPGSQGPQGSKGSQGSQGGPSQPPPSFTPQQPKSQQSGPSAKFIDSGAIRPCTFRFVYIWPRRGRGFWAWLTFVGPRSVAGFKWSGNRWRYFGMDLRQIDSFQCF
ncbi:hypothetical protein LGK97_13505 [Clostridium sp. CS001]|uniref:hypothetical protein n=1 Tax=Clostridium sp. CS001 TaxID=2880648 RepID=UPI001CF2F9AC|nr:hypothetical protein [Clostridium sp. CS001]MCB2290757.1 hypothetical protein [Clostridium sp. CS001]